MTESWSGRSPRPTLIARSAERPHLARDEKRVPGRFDELWSELGLHATRGRHVHQPFEQVARMVAPQRPPAVKGRDHFQRAWVGRYGQTLALPFEDPAPHLPGRVRHQDLVGEPTKVRLVQQLCGT